jgi:pantoate--beta-alanine ligase
MHVKSLLEAREILSDLWKKNESIGSVHTLGALHIAHAQLIRRSAKENTHTVVTVYPNKIQLFPGLRYNYILEDDVKLALENGATMVISSTDEEMFPAGYCTFLDQGIAHKALNSSVFDYAARGQVTGSVRWINFCRPTVSYFGMKDIEQALLVDRAVRDLLIPTKISHVPCVRTRTGVPVSSRLQFLPPEKLNDVSVVYQGLKKAREMILTGERQSRTVIAFLSDFYNSGIKNFDVKYITIVAAGDFHPIARIELPFIVHVCISDGRTTHFDGLPILTDSDLSRGPETIWV